jgi:3-(3-hydroxy-phenyl)propionate hydroxylase
MRRAVSRLRAGADGEVVPGVSRYEIAHTTLYRVHQRVATTFPQGPRVPDRRRRAHQQSARRHGDERRHPRCDQPDRTPRRGLAWLAGGRANSIASTEQRRLVTKEYVEKRSIQNKKDLEAPGTRIP